jgi:predicted HAD superfamily hydrolase
MQYNCCNNRITICRSQFDVTIERSCKCDDLREFFIFYFSYISASLNLGRISDDLRSNSKVLDLELLVQVTMKVVCWICWKQCCCRQADPKF